MNTSRVSRIVGLFASVVIAGACDAQPQANEPGGEQKPKEAPAEKTGTSTPDPHAEPFTVAGVTFDAPSAFDKVDVPAGGMRAAQFKVAIPDDMEASEGGEVVFFYFGPNGAGDVDANLARWATMVTDAKGQPTTPTVTTRKIGALTVTEASYEGTFMSGMPGADKTPKPGFTMIGAIVEGGPQGMVVARFTGPVGVVKMNRALWDRMITSARVEKK